MAGPRVALLKSGETRLWEVEGVADDTQHRVVASQAWAGSVTGVGFGGHAMKWPRAAQAVWGLGLREFVDARILEAGPPALD